MTTTRTGLLTLLLFACAVLETVGVGSAAPTWNPTPVGTDLQGNTTLTLDADYSMTEVYSGAYSLTMNTEGHTLTLTNAARQQYTGGTIINGNGIVAINGSKGNAGVGVFPGTATINTGATLQFWNAAISGYGSTATAYVLNGGTIDGSKATAVLGSGHLLGLLTFSDGGKAVDTRTTTSDSWAGNFGLENNVSVTSGTTNLIQAERISMPARGTGTGSLLFTVNANTKLTVDGTLTEANTCPDTAGQGVRSIVKAGEGTLFVKAGTYTGSTRINEGTLQIGSDNAISSAKLNLTGGTLDLNGHNLSVTPNTNLAGNVANSGTEKSTLTLNIASANTYDLAGVMSGNTELKLQGGGTLTVSKSQTYTGGTVVENGKLTLTNNSNTWTTADGQKYGTLRGTITVKPNGTLAFTAQGIMGYGTTAMTSLVVQGGTVDNTDSTTHNLIGPLTLSDNGVLKDTTTGKTGWAGNFGLDNKVTVTSGTNNQINAEKVVLSARYSSTVGTVNFDVQGTSALTINGNLLNSSTTVIMDRSLLKTGSGTLTLTGEANEYLGATTISEGTLEINTRANASNTIQYATSDISVGGDAEQAALNIATNAGQSLAFTATGATIAVKNNGLLTFDTDGETLDLTANINVSGTGRMELDVNGSVADELALNGALTLASFDSLVVDIADTPVWGGEYPVFSASRGISVGGTAITTAEQFAQFLTSEAAHYLNVSLDGTGNFVLSTNSAAVPEPASFLLLLLGLAGLVKSRRR